MNAIFREFFDEELLELSSPVPRVLFSSPRQISEAAQNRKPVIFSGAPDNWLARLKWTPEYFSARWGSRTVTAYETKWLEQTPYLFNTNQFKAKKSLAAFLGNVPTGDVYIPQMDAAIHFPGSQEDLKFDTLIESGTVKGDLQPKIWLGTSGTRSGLHFDPADNLIAMFYGIKGGSCWPLRRSRGGCIHFHKTPPKARLIQKVLSGSVFQNSREPPYTSMRLLPENCCSCRAIGGITFRPCNFR